MGGCGETIPSSVKGIPLLVRDDRLLLGRGYRVYEHLLTSGEERLVASYQPPPAKRLLAATPLGCRTAREGIHRLYETPNGDWLAIGKGAILFCRAGSDQFVTACTAHRGSRPLYLCHDPVADHWYFGEYFSNPDREEVRIYTSRDGSTWSIAYTFDAGEIRHVHNVVYDPYREGLWILTGDSDEESGLFFTANAFATVEKKFGGSQTYRAVSVLCLPEGLLIPMDTPHETNAIHLQRLPDGQLTHQADLASSAFHALEVPEGYVVTTVGEPSSVNDAHHARVYFCRRDDRVWREVNCYPADALSASSNRFFRYPEIIPIGCTNNGVLYCVGIGLTSQAYGILKINLERTLLEKT